MRKYASTDPLQILFMLLIGTLGSKPHPSTAQINTVVASIILFFVSVKISYSTCAFLMGSEIGGTLMRKKGEYCLLLR